jgi:hypothetical protein
MNAPELVKLDSRSWRKSDSDSMQFFLTPSSESSAAMSASTYSAKSPASASALTLLVASQRRNMEAYIFSNLGTTQSFRAILSFSSESIAVLRSIHVW